MSCVESSPEVMGGALVFKGTRVPVATLFDYLEAGDSVAAFLDDFPTVSNDQVVGILEEMKGNLAGVVAVA